MASLGTTRYDSLLFYKSLLKKWLNLNPLPHSSDTLIPHYPYFALFTLTLNVGISPMFPLHTLKLTLN